MITTGVMPKSLKETIIIVIPKPNKPKGPVKNAIPISLLEIHRKIISRAFNNRLKNLLIENNNIIEHNQSCHPNRNINENIQIINLISILSKYKKNKNKRYKAIFLDFAKAFDRIDHNYLLHALKAKGFGPNFRRYIKSNLESNARVQVGNSFPNNLQLKEVYHKVM